MDISIINEDGDIRRAQVTKAEWKKEVAIGKPLSKS